jgi:LssY C-terminus
MKPLPLLFVVSLVALALCSCSRSPPDPSGRDTFTSRAMTQQQGGVTVHAAVLSDDESARYFGVALADKGIQAVWLSVENGRDGPLYYLPATTDGEYYTPPEVSRMFQSWLPSEAARRRRSLFTREAMPDLISPHQKASGFVMTHREGGLKFLRASFIGAGQQFDFRFVIPLESKLYAAQKVDFRTRSPSSGNVNLDGLRAKLEAMQCCTTDKAGDRSGDPLNIVIIGRGDNAIFPFIERGWRLDEPLDVHSILRTISAFLLGTEYTTAPVSPLYVFGRPQDIALQKARNNISLRNHLRVWRAPFTFEGQDVWVGQISRDIGTKLTTQSWYLTTHRISPEIDQDRYYLLQDLLLTGEVDRFGFVSGVGVSTAADPRENLGYDPYVTDGLRLVIFLGAQHSPITDVEFVNCARPSR